MERTKLTCILPVFGRPQRTKRAIQSVLAQEFEGWQLIIINDACPYFEHKWLQDIRVSQNNELTYLTLDTNHNDYGSHARWIGLQFANGEHTIFLDNDDVILPKHFQNYQSIMDMHPHAVMGYTNTYVEPINYIREPRLEFGSIGHAEIIVKTDILKEAYQIDPSYGHDWTLIQRICGRGEVVYHKSTPTYIIKSLQSHRESDID